MESGTSPKTVSLLRFRAKKMKIKEDDPLKIRVRGEISLAAPTPCPAAKSATVPATLRNMLLTPAGDRHIPEPIPSPLTL